MQARRLRAQPPETQSRIQVVPLAEHGDARVSGGIHCLQPAYKVSLGQGVDRNVRIGAALDQKCPKECFKMR